MEDDLPWRGVPISQLQTSFNHSQFPELVNYDEHSILFEIPVTVGKVPECFPSVSNKRDFWDLDHVELPCSDRNVTDDQVSRWDLIRTALTSPISSVEQFQAAVLSYNTPFASLWNFSTLRLFFEDTQNETKTLMFFEDLLPKIIELALRLPELITGGIPLLKCGHKRSVSLSQLQISCLLANAFLCTFPHRNCSGYSYINFNRLFECKSKNRMQSVLEKIKCLLNYFRRVTSKVPTGIVTVSRQLIPINLLPRWSESNKLLPRLYVSSEGTIEDGYGLFQMDFANKMVGGGVLRTGCVQEEIRFVICPELIISRLFTQALTDNEALVITGCEQFNEHKGYASTFEWVGDYVDETPSDAYGRKYCTVIALDALRFVQNPLSQYSPANFSRDLNKAYVGFSWDSRRKKEELCAVATGNWGCGAFKGDPKLKSFLQLMAAGEVGRDLAYFTFGDKELRDGLAETHEFLVENKVTIGKIFTLLGEYHSKEFFEYVSVFEFLRENALKNPEDIKMEIDVSKMNEDLRRLKVTKKSSKGKAKIDNPKKGKKSVKRTEKRSSGGDEALLTDENGFEFLNEFFETRSDATIEQ